MYPLAHLFEQIMHFSFTLCSNITKFLYITLIVNRYPWTKVTSVFRFRSLPHRNKAARIKERKSDMLLHPSENSDAFSPTMPLLHSNRNKIIGLPFCWWIFLNGIPCMLLIQISLKFSCLGDKPQTESILSLSLTSPSLNSNLFNCLWWIKRRTGKSPLSDPMMA